ncbi:receptor-like protein 9DC3 [Vigna umbellata]|uniref:receptor-like protein 9DC3 n=1 Tax=Vigna umbellata TaxID=87088 RepID=UPI001F5F7B34|nr:receptor-like protein 9DC3 [Vigna umbellata]
MGWILVSYLIIFQSLLLHFSSYNCLSCNPHDKSALLQFKNSVAVVELPPSFDPCHSYSPKTASWNNETDCCGWDGVICDSELGHVIGLDLSCTPLKGELLGPNSSIFKLSHLQHLSLLSYDLDGSPIHSAIGDLVSLTYLTLHYLRISGDVPSTISHFSKLEHLDLTVESLDSTPRLDSYTWNKLIHNATNLREISLSGVNMSSVGESSLSLLTNLSSSLLSLRFTDTKLQGKWPTDIFRLPNLQEIHILVNENLRGELPNSNWTSPLKTLFISQTNFSGDIPDSIAHLKSLNSLSLFESNFDGFIPPSLFDLTHLIFLYLSDNNLVGPISTQIIKLSNLLILDLSGNMLNGSVPLGCYSLPSLLILDLSNNQLTGSIGEFSTNSLQFVKLSNNKLEGNFPNFLAPHIQVLDMSHNNLTGLIPKCLGTFIFLWALDLQDNNLYGSIPDNFSEGNAFETIKLNGNHLKGPLPRTLNHCTKLEVLNLGNNDIEDTFPSCLTYLTLHYLRINGDVPSKISHLSKLKNLDLNVKSNESKPRLDSYTWNKLIHNATNLREISLRGVNMSSVGESSLSLLTNLSSSLLSLRFTDTKLQGKWPTDIFRLPNLQEIHILVNENLRGELPNSNWTSPLKTLFISQTNFSGDIPDSIAHLKSLNSLSLFESNFDGFIPPSLFDLTHLIFLYLSDNNLVGPISTQIIKLSNLLILDLSGNMLNGSVPLGCYSLPSLLILDLSNNQLTGSIGEFSTNSLQFVKLSNNKLEGNFPNFLAPHIQVLDISHNNLTGLIPKCLGTFIFLWALDLQDNNLYGSIPDNFSEGNAFETIKLNGNHLKGPLPRTLNHCTKLEVLNLGNNDIEDTFPSWLETLPTLQVLGLQSNKFHGNITSLGTKHSFPRLRIFDISNNYFIGPLPTSYIVNFQEMMNVNHSQTGSTYLGNRRTYNDSIVGVMKGLQRELTRIFTTWVVIDLSNNMFEGEIPKAIGELKSLIGLNLSHNKITGTIPLSLSNLSNLEWLDLSWNQLKGEIPMTLTNLNFLSFLNLSQNQLEGVIPTGGQFNIFENISYVGNPMLCGFPLSRSCKGNKERSQGSTFDEVESGFGWKAVVIGYAFGTIFGIILGYNVFFAGKPQWLARLVEVVFNVRLPKTNNKKRVIRLGRKN